MAARIYKSEGPADYGSYRFGYCEWMECGHDDPLDAAYSAGFLPYSARPGEEKHLFYRARSLRVDLESFSADKKRRYDHRLWAASGLERRLYGKEAFLEEFGESALGQARAWMETRFGEAYLQPERLRYVMGKPFLNHVLAWISGGALTAFALVVKGSWGAHYWYVFYRNGEGTASPPGHGYLLDFLQWCREENLPYAYLGTAYGRKSRYKSRGITGIEFWDGNGWNPDRVRLADLQEKD